MTQQKYVGNSGHLIGAGHPIIAPTPIPTRLSPISPFSSLNSCLLSPISCVLSPISILLFPVSHLSFLGSCLLVSISYLLSIASRFLSSFTILPSPSLSSTPVSHLPSPLLSFPLLTPHPLNYYTVQCTYEGGAAGKIDHLEGQRLTAMREEGCPLGEGLISIREEG